MTEAQVGQSATSCKCQYIPPTVDTHASEGQTERPRALWEWSLMETSHSPHQDLRASVLQVSLLK